MKKILTNLFFIFLLSSCEPIYDNCGEYGCGEGGKCVLNGDTKHCNCKEGYAIYSISFTSENSSTEYQEYCISPKQVLGMYGSKIKILLENNTPELPEPFRCSENYIFNRYTDVHSVYYGFYLTTSEKTVKPDSFMKKYVNECEGDPFHWFYEQFKEVTIDDGVKQIGREASNIQIILSKKGELIIYDQFFSKLLTTYTHPEQKIEQFTVILDEFNKLELGYRVENGDMYYLFASIESTNGTDDIYQFETKKIENISNVSSIANYKLRFETSLRYLCGLSENRVKCVDVSKNLTDIFEPFDKIPNDNEIVEYLDYQSIITDKNIYFVRTERINNTSEKFVIRYRQRAYLKDFVIQGNYFCYINNYNNSDCYEIDINRVLE